MGAINARNLPEFTGKDILIQAMESAETTLPDYRLNAEATFIIGLCTIIQGLRDDVELLERRIEELEQR